MTRGKKKRKRKGVRVHMGKTGGVRKTTMT
jgi:hypothetical protein